MSCCKPLNHFAAACDLPASMKMKMRFRSDSARAESSTRYAKQPAHLLEHLVRSACAARTDIFVALTNGFILIGQRSEIAQTLILGGVLKNGFRLAVYGEDQRPARALRLIEHLSDMVAEHV